jgi:hypothetical protein
MSFETSYTFSITGLLIDQLYQWDRKPEDSKIKETFRSIAIKIACAILPIFTSIMDFTMQLGIALIKATAKLVSYPFKCNDFKRHVNYSSRNFAVSLMHLAGTLITPVLSCTNLNDTKRMYRYLKNDIFSAIEKYNQNFSQPVYP